MQAQAYRERYGAILEKYPDCASIYYYIKNKMTGYSYNSSTYSLLEALKQNIEGIVSLTGVNDRNTLAHCQTFLVQAYRAN